MDEITPKKKPRSFVYLFVFLIVAIAIFSFFWFRTPSQDIEELIESDEIIQEKPIDYEEPIDINKVKDNLSVEEENNQGIKFRTIHATCRPENPDCYVISTPFNFRYVEGEDKIQLSLIRVENNDLRSPDLTYWEYNENEETQKYQLKNLRIETVDYPYIGSKGNVFLDLTLDMGNTYCFQLSEGDRKSEVWCQNLEIDPLKENGPIQFSLIPSENQSQLHLAIIFNAYAEETVKNLLKESSLTLNYPEEFNKGSVEFSSEDLLSNLKYCNNYYLVDLPLSLEESLVHLLMPDVENYTIIPSDYVVEVELKHQDASLKQEATVDSSCEGPLFLCDNYV